VKEVCAGTPFQQYRVVAEDSCLACNTFLGPQAAVGTMQPDWSNWIGDPSLKCPDEVVTQHRYDRNGCVDWQTREVSGTKQNCDCECPEGWSSAAPAASVSTGLQCPEGQTLQTTGGTGDNPCETCYKCECCESACCMYSAKDFYTGKLSIDDLPDQISITNGGLVLFNEIFQKSENGYVNDHFQIKAFYNIIIPNSYYWLIFNDSTDQSLIDSENGYCLISPIKDGDFAEDFFATTYLISLNGNPLLNVIREESDDDLKTYISRWRGPSILLEFNCKAKWAVNGNYKIGNQNTPVGIYEGGYTVS